MPDGECRGCGCSLPGGGYLCDDCDTLEIVDCSAGWKAEARHQRASAGRGHE